MRSARSDDGSGALEFHESQHEYHWSVRVDLATAAIARYTRAVPALLRVRGYRFYFYRLEDREPPHIHVAHAGRYAKFWIEPVSSRAIEAFGVTN